MQKTRLKKKGFTLVELVIVVAVIAVLSAILIPSIGCVVEQAKETNDIATVRLLNVALVEDGTENDKPATMSDALAAMARKGYLIDKLTPRSSGEILWDSVNNRFALYKDGTPLDTSTTAPDKVNLWKIIKKGETLSSDYSNYLSDEYESKSVEATTGVDVGNNENINVKYTGAASAQSVTIRTNGGKLEIEAANDTVNHYGEAAITALTKVKSYNEFGSVYAINLVSGEATLGNGCDVTILEVKSTDTSASVKGSSGAKLGTLYVNTASCGTLDLTGVACTEIAKSSVADNVTVAGSDLKASEVTVVEGFEAGLGTQASPYLVASETQLTKALEQTTESSIYFNVGLPVEVTSTQTLNVNAGIHVTINEKGSLKLDSQASLTVAANSSLTVDGDLNVTGQASATIVGTLTCNGNVNVSGGGALTLGKENSSTKVVIGKDAVCVADSAKLTVNATIVLEGVLDLTNLGYGNDALIPGKDGKIKIKSTGKLYMLKAFQGTEPKNLTILETPETGATLIYEKGNTGNEGTYIYSGSAWVKQ